METKSQEFKTNITEEPNQIMGALHARDVEIKKLSEELDSVRAELDNVKSTSLNILSNVSHELRTPITSIKAFADMLLMFGNEDPEAQEEFLNSIIEQCDRLIEMINGALDISKMESGKMEWNIIPMDITEVIQSSATVIDWMLEPSGLSLEFKVSDNLPLIQGDRDRLLQVMVNLIGNAIKFTEEGQITIGAKNGNNEITVSVSDTGIGVEPENQELIFGEFYQVGHILTDKPKGIGLGLPICRNIVTNHGGRIWMESEPGVGSTFYFTLPLKMEGDDEEVIEATDSFQQLN